MSRQRRRVLVRVVGTLGVLSQVVVGLMAIVIFPAAFVSAVTGGAGLRLVTRDPEDASMRLGVAVLASGVGLVAGLASGVLPMAVTAVCSTACFVLAWSTIQGLRTEDRVAFGIKHRDWEHRNRQLHERRDRLVDRRADAPSEPVRREPPPDASSPSETEWWEQLD